MNNEKIDKDFVSDLIDKIEICEQDRTIKNFLRTPEIHIYYVGVGNVEELVK